MFSQQLLSYLVVEINAELLSSWFRTERKRGESGHFVAADFVFE